MDSPIVWLASYPRSGNTFLRTIIFQCFGVRSGSVYPRDLGLQSGVENLTGHIEHGPGGTIDFGDEPVRLIKTHSLPPDDRPAIYVLRDGRAAAISLYQFWRGQRSLADIIAGKTIFSTWTAHVGAWDPRERPDTLFLRYEDLVADLGACVDRIGEHLKLVPKTRAMPSRAELAAADGKWIRPGDAPRLELEGADLALFWQVNGEAMRAYGYA